MKVSLKLVPAVALLVVSSTWAETPPLPANFRLTDMSMILEDVDGLIAWLNLMPKDLAADFAGEPPDHSGRNVNQDIADYLLTTPVVQQIENARRHIRETTSTATSVVARESVQRLEDLVRPEFCRAVVLRAYWDQRRMREKHHELIRAVVKPLPPFYERSVAVDLAALDRTSDGLRDLVASAIADCAVGERDPSAFVRRSQAVLPEYDRIRVDVMDEQRGLRGNRDPDTAWALRTQSCPAPVSAGTGGRSPLRMIRTPVLDDFYPEQLRRLWVTGTARVQVDVDAGGCVTAVRLWNSTGSKDLDQAALDVAFQIRFQPAAIDGRPISSKGIIPIRFAMPDESATSTASQPQP